MLQSLKFIFLICYHKKSFFSFYRKSYLFPLCITRKTKGKQLFKKLHTNVMIFNKDTLGNIVAGLQNPKQLLSSNDFPKGLILERNKESFFTKHDLNTYNKRGLRVDSVNDLRSDVWIISSAIKDSLFCCFGLCCCAKLSHCFWSERLNWEYINLKIQLVLPKPNLLPWS